MRILSDQYFFFIRYRYNFAGIHKIILIGAAEHLDGQILIAEPWRYLQLTLTILVNDTRWIVVVVMVAFWTRCRQRKIRIRIPVILYFIAASPSLIFIIIIFFLCVCVDICLYLEKKYWRGNRGFGELETPFWGAFVLEFCQQSFFFFVCISLPLYYKVFSLLLDLRLVPYLLFMFTCLNIGRSSFL